MIKDLIQVKNTGNSNIIEFPYVCFDVESDGLDFFANEVVEICAIEFNLSGVIGDVLSFICCNQSGIMPAEATKVNGITTEMIKGKKSYLRDGIREIFASFVGKRPVVGQNVGFDIRMSKVAPTSSFDVLKMAKTVFVGQKNFKLIDICKKLGIEFNPEEAHRAEYDVRKTIPCFIELKKRLDVIRAENSTLPLFRSVAPEKVIANELTVEEYFEEEADEGVVLSERDKRMLATQAYSYSRISAFQRCPLQWYYLYIKKIKQESEPLIIGVTCHEIADVTSKWCYLELFKNKIKAMHTARHLELKKSGDDICKELSISGKFTYGKLAKALYHNRSKCEFVFGMGYLDLIYLMDEKLNINDYEIPSMPPYEVYNKIVTRAISKYNVTDGVSISEIKYIMNRFYNSHDFSLYPGDIIVTEKQIAFDKDWNIEDDWFGSNVFWRGKIDKIRWEGDIIDIEDYKTNRVVPSIKELKEDMQTKSYVMCVVYYVGRENVENIRVRLNYLRHNECLELIYTGNEIDDVISEVKTWINTYVEEIESQLANSKNAFKPCRNEYCSTCLLFQDGRCPLFDIKKIGDVKSTDFQVTNVNQCIKMYKQAELLKIQRDKIMKACSTFIKTAGDAPVLIDKVAKLDFHKTEMHRVDVPALITTLLKMKSDPDTNIDLKTILKHLSISKKNIDKLSDKIGVDISSLNTEDNEIFTRYIKQEFKALILKDEDEDEEENGEDGGKEQ